MTAHNVTVEDSSPLVVYRNYSQWVDSPHNDPTYSEYSGPSESFNSFHITNASTSVDFPFNGSAIYVYGSTGPTHGPFTVTLYPNYTAQTTGTFNLGGLDDAPGVEVTNSTSFGGQLFQQLLYTKKGLDKFLPHSITITNSGQGQFILDYFIIETDVGQTNSTVTEYTLDDTHPAFTYPIGPWDTNLTSLENNPTGRAFLQLFQNQTLHSTDAIGAQTNLTFRGSGVSLYGVWYHGGFFVRVDDRATVAVKSSNTGLEAGSYNRPRELIYTTDSLGEGMHTISVTNNQDAPLSIDYAIVSTTDPKNLDGVSPPSSRQSDPPPKHTDKSTNAENLGPIIGGAVGGVVLLALIGAVLWWWNRRRKRMARDRIDLLADADDSESVRQANTWVPWRPSSIRAGGEASQGHSRGGSTNPSTSASRLLNNGPSNAILTDASLTSMTSVERSLTSTTSAEASYPVVDTSEPFAGTPSGTEKRRRMPQQPEPTPRHEDDAGVTLLRAGTVRTLPPLYDAQWDRDRSVAT